MWLVTYVIYVVVVRKPEILENETTEDLRDLNEDLLDLNGTTTLRIVSRIKKDTIGTPATLVYLKVWFVSSF